MFAREYAGRENDDAAKRIAVRSDEDVLASVDGGNERGLEVGDGSSGGEFEGFTVRRWNVVGTTPDVDLVCAVLVTGSVLVEPLKVAVHALVEPPALDDRHPERVELLQGEPGRLDGAREPRRIHSVDGKPMSSE